MRTRRRKPFRFGATITLACGAAAFLLCWIGNAVVGPPYHFGWMALIALFVMVLMAGFLWIRLTPDAPKA